MTEMRRPSVVVLGMITKMPVAGVIWQTLHYLLGFQRLGYDAYYVEAHGRTPSMLMQLESDDGAARAASLLAAMMRRFGLGHRWAYVALHEGDGRCFGMSHAALRRLYASADMLLDLHGGTAPTDELAATDRLVYLETDPVQLQLELAGGYQPTRDFLDAHCAFFTFAENYGGPDCALPVSDLYPFEKTRQPVVLDLWETAAPPDGTAFTTIGNWRQSWRDVSVDGETYTWSKHHEFAKFLDAPEVAGARFELALASYADEDRSMLEARGWRVRRALDFSMDLHAYRRYIARSYGEFTAAKEQNVRLRTGWFSDRSATYLATGRPVITQDTGFGAVLPTGNGLFPFASLDEVRDAVERIDAEPERHRRSAVEIAREFFSHDVVLGELLAHLGMGAPPTHAAEGVDVRPRRAFPFDMVITPVSRRPTRLADETIDAVLSSPLPRAPVAAGAATPDASIVVVSFNTLLFTRLCLETVLANTESPAFELVVVDNGSTDGSVDYLYDLDARDPRVRVVANTENAGFPAACNQGLELARGGFLVLLNSDTMVPPGWLGRLLAPVERDPMVLAGPVTNRIGNEAEVRTGYDTWGDFIREARSRADSKRGKAFEIATLTMFCLAMSRAAYERLGPLDEGFGIGTLEDDDYSKRALEDGCTLLCVEDVLVHHFGEGSFGKLFADGEYSRVIGENRRRFERKWGSAWEPYSRRPDPEYAELVEHFRRALGDAVPRGATVLVVSKGDDALVEVDGIQAWHFPRGPEGEWAGYNPSDGREAVAWIDELRERGAGYIAFPRTSLWWLDFYEGLADRLAREGGALLRTDAVAVFALSPEAAGGAEDGLARAEHCR